MLFRLSMGMSKDLVVCAETASEVSGIMVGRDPKDYRKASTEDINFLIGVITSLVLVMVPFTEQKALQWAGWGQAMTP